ncbi:hypothetical protein ACJMK2_032864 [Sinanodonta woodiana]|uniref:G-protein coupled receptors family 1 profile domain-containing protein n=1 Tax=Sinanodonta woodiana TaxID=1069815 RepID=A0ABD3X3A4_SINWO
MIPIAVFTKHMTLRSGVKICREDWTNKKFEMAYTVFLDVVLLLVPLCIMAGAYVKIVRTLRAGIMMGEQMEYTSSSRCGQTKKLACELTSLRKTSVRSYILANGSSIPLKQCSLNQTRHIHEGSLSESPCSSQESTPRRKMDKTEFIRQSNFEKSRTSKLRVIRMLFVVVVEFFICWTPLYFVNTWLSYDRKSVEVTISNLTMSLIFLLSYLSSCCNPITYCFMNSSFRQSFLAAIQCCLRGRQDLGRYPSLNSKTSYRTSVHRMTFYERCNDNIDQCDKSLETGDE